MHSATISKPAPAKSGASNVACALNASYDVALRRRTFSNQANAYGSILTDGKVKIPVNKVGTLGCCGISELNMVSLGTAKTVSDDDDFEEVAAKYIRASTNGYADNRILIVGLPIENMNGHASGYDFTFYNRLLKVLLKFGFRQVGKKYENMNSHNKVVVLTAQLP